MQVQPYLFFDGRCEEAVEFYRSALGAEVVMVMRFKDSPDPPPPGMVPPGPEKVMHAALRVGDAMVLASDGRCSGQPSFQGFALSLTAANEAEANRPCASLANLSCKPLHIRKLRFVSPSIINHRIRTRPSTWTERSCEFSILENLLAAAVSVCVVPVIRAVDYVRHRARLRAHHFAEFPERNQRIFARLTPARDDSSGMKLPLPQLDA